MPANELKCVMVVDEAMPQGIIANSTAVMGVTIGKLFPEVVGQDVVDQTGYRHQGIIEFPIPILKVIFYEICGNGCMNQILNS